MELWWNLSDAADQTILVVFWRILRDNEWIWMTILKKGYNWAQTLLWHKGTLAEDSYYQHQCFFISAKTKDGVILF
jgi:hypothetical protein